MTLDSCHTNRNGNRCLFFFQFYFLLSIFNKILNLKKTLNYIFLNYYLRLELCILSLAQKDHKLSILSKINEEIYTIF